MLLLFIAVFFVALAGLNQVDRDWLIIFNLFISFHYNFHKVIILQTILYRIIITKIMRTDNSIFSKKWFIM
jgi:hypothetical protein